MYLYIPNKDVFKLLYFPNTLTKENNGTKFVQEQCSTKVLQDKKKYKNEIQLSTQILNLLMKVMLNFKDNIVYKIIKVSA